MAIKPVTYNAASLTQDPKWFTDEDGNGIPDKAVDIKKDNAEYILKDSQAGKTDISAGEIGKARQGSATDPRATYLVKFAGDTVEYSKDEAKETGKSQIDTSKSDDDGSDGAAVAGVAVSGAALVLCVLALAIQKGTFAQVAAIAVCAMGAADLGLAFAFDPNLNNREKETNNAPKNNDIFDNYNQECLNNVEYMAEESSQYDEASGTLLEAQLDLLDQRTTLQSEIMTAESMGDVEKAKQLREKLKSLEDGGEADINSQLEGLQTFKDLLSDYENTAAEAEGANESGRAVSKFLKHGRTLQTHANISGAMTALTAAAAGLAASGVFGSDPIDEICATLARILFAVDAALYGTASGIFFSKASKEGAAADAGEDMNDHLDTMMESQRSSIEAIGTNASGYEETDADVDKQNKDAEKKARQSLSKTEKYLNKDKDEDEDEGDGEGNGGGENA